MRFVVVFIRVGEGQYGGSVLAAYAHVRGPKGGKREAKGMVTGGYS